MAKTVRQLLNQARDFHSQLQTFYSHCGSTSKSARVKLLTDYMVRHEEAIEQALADYEDGAAKCILNTWLEFTPGNETVSCFENIDVTPRMSVDDIVKLTLRFDEALIKFYRLIIDKTNTSDVRELFSRLAEQEAFDRRENVRNALELDEL